MKTNDIQQKILETATALIQTNGFNAFSYKDISETVGIKTSSIHYYFPTKGHLGQAVIKMHIESLCNELENISLNKQLSCKKKLERFIDHIVANTYSQGRKMCLGGILASDILTLPEIVQHEVRAFFTRLEDWVKQLLIEAINKKEFKADKKNIKQEIFLIFSLLEGALLLARLYQDEGYLVVARKHILDHFL